MECLAALGVERREERVLEPLDQAAKPDELPLAVGRDADQVAAPVLRVALPHDQAPLLERVEQADQPAAVECERVGDRRLRLLGALGEERQHAVVVDLEAGLLELRDRLRLEPEAEPREQEAAARDQFLRDPMNRPAGVSVAGIVIAE